MYFSYIFEVLYFRNFDIKEFYYYVEFFASVSLYLLCFVYFCKFLKGFERQLVNDSITKKRHTWTLVYIFAFIGAYPMCEIQAVILREILNF